MKTKMLLADLTVAVINKMRELGYSEGLTCQHESVYRKLCNFASKEHMAYFTDDFGQRFLLEVYLLSASTHQPEWSRCQQYAHSAIGKLVSFQENGTFAYYYPDKDSSTSWAMDDESVLLEYVQTKEPIDSIRTNIKPRCVVIIEKLYKSIAAAGCKSARELTAERCSDFIKSISGLTTRYTRIICAEIRAYLRFLFRRGYILNDFSVVIPRISVPEASKVPAIWSDSDIQKVLGSIDRTTAIGKRDYAILLLCFSLGLRSSDASYIKLKDLDWKRKEIVLTQPKTGVVNVCPMTGEIGWALIEYLRVRQTRGDSPYVFLQGRAPFSAFGESTTRHILERYIRKSGIAPKPLGVARGTHSIRHSFARKLLSQNVPLELISDVLGHTTLTSSSPYLKVDIEGLRFCALSLDDEVGYAE